MAKKTIVIIFGLILIVSVLYGCCGGDEDPEGDMPEDQEDVPEVPVGAPAAALNICNPSIEVPDGVDNDCDGAIDEEDCGDAFDNDGDGEIDEGCF